MLKLYNSPASWIQISFPQLTQYGIIACWDRKGLLGPGPCTNPSISFLNFLWDSKADWEFSAPYSSLFHGCAARTEREFFRASATCYLSIIFAVMLPARTNLTSAIWLFDQLKATLVTPCFLFPGPNLPFFFFHLFFVYQSFQTSYLPSHWVLYVLVCQCLLFPSILWYGLTKPDSEGLSWQPCFAVGSHWVKNHPLD